MFFVQGLCAQALDPAKLLQPPTDTWPTFNGDYSGRRYSPLKQVNATNVKSLGLAWAYHARTDGSNPFGAQIKATPLEVNGVLYFTVPDHAWAIDAKTGRELWHYKWESQGGIHIGNRGVGIYGDWLFFETPDNHLVSLNAKDGKLRWSVEIADGRDPIRLQAVSVGGNRDIYFTFHSSIPVEYSGCICTSSLSASVLTGLNLTRL
jgi:alcohol dehydrogenase (cytochrome c)